MWEECGKSVGRVWEECGEECVKSVGRVWKECGKSVVRVWEECEKSVGRVCEECEKSVEGSKRHIIQVVELSQQLQTAVQIVSKPPARFSVFWASQPGGPAGWLALLLIKAGDVERNPGPTTTHKHICDICHKQIH